MCTGPSCPTARRRSEVGDHGVDELVERRRARPAARGRRAPRRGRRCRSSRSARRPGPWRRGPWDRAARTAPAACRRRPRRSAARRRRGRRRTRSRSARYGLITGTSATRPASAISRATSPTRRTFSVRSAAENPRSALSPWRTLSPSSTYVACRSCEEARGDGVGQRRLARSRQPGEPHRRAAQSRRRPAAVPVDRRRVPEDPLGVTRWCGACRRRRSGSSPRRSARSCR